MKFQFEKKGHLIEVIQDGIRVNAICNGIESAANPEQRNGVWGYWIIDDEFCEIFTGKKVNDGGGFFIHESAKEMSYAIKNWDRITREKGMEKIIKNMKADQIFYNEAKEKGEPILIVTYPVPCNDPKEECDLDMISVYAMPDGSNKVSRVHTW